MDADTTDLLAWLELPHQRGHSCRGSYGATAWFNPNAGSTGACPTLVALRDLRAVLETAYAAVTAERARVHDAAHHTPAAEHVAQAMTGLVMAELAQDDRHGWTMTARMAIEGLAEWLDRP